MLSSLMGRRSDHTPAELRELFIASGHDLMAERGFSKFSAREAARLAGYSVGTIYNVFGSLDGYLIAINSRTFQLWGGWLERALSETPHTGTARLEALVRAYFGFADANRNIWMAIYDHRIDRTIAIAQDVENAREALTSLVYQEVEAWMGLKDEGLRRLVSSLIATVHGHCALWLSGSFAVLQADDPAEQALARVLESLNAYRAR